MKRIFILAAIVGTTFCVKAQVANTKWRATITLDSPTDVFFYFKTDSLRVATVNGDNDVEMMKYTLKDSVLTIQKIFGGSNCDTNTPGNYKVEMTGSAIVLRLVSDACDDRSSVVTDLKLTKEK